MNKCFPAGVSHISIRLWNLCSDCSADILHGHSQTLAIVWCFVEREGFLRFQGILNMKMASTRSTIPPLRRGHRVEKLQINLLEVHTVH